MRRSIRWLTAAAFLFISAATNAATKPVYYIYLAGPEVFLPKPVKAGEDKKDLIKHLNEQHDWPFRLVGLYPLDNEIPDFKPDRDTGLRIYQANLALMEKAHFISANMVRFRGPSMDVGTAFEMGYMRGAGKPVFAYYDAEPFYGESEPPGLYAARVATYYKLDPTNSQVDIDGQSVENFAMADNLMMMGALDDAGGGIQPSFRAVVLRIAEYLRTWLPSASEGSGPPRGSASGGLPSTCQNAQ